MVRRLLLTVALGGALAGACKGDASIPAATTTSTTSAKTPTTAPSPTPASASTVSSSLVSPTTVPPTPATVTVSYRLERRTADDATADFEAVVGATLGDSRGWSRARFRFLRDDAAAPYLIVLAEGDEVDRLCLPYDTYGKYSCQNGPVVALNADRWRSADPKWTGDLPTYRQMLVNHEVGHLLGQKHPRPQCPQPGQPAPVMNQQSTELNGCLPNPWPLPWEIALAARHDRPLAPGPERG